METKHFQILMKKIDYNTDEYCGIPISFILSSVIVNLQSKMIWVMPVKVCDVLYNLHCDYRWYHLFPFHISFRTLCSNGDTTQVYVAYFDNFCTLLHLTTLNYCKYRLAFAFGLKSVFLQFIKYCDLYFLYFFYFYMFVHILKSIQEI